MAGCGDHEPGVGVRTTCDGVGAIPVGSRRSWGDDKKSDCHRGQQDDAAGRITDSWFRQRYFILFDRCVLNRSIDDNAFL